MGGGLRDSRASWVGVELGLGVLACYGFPVGLHLHPRRRFLAQVVLGCLACLTLCACPLALFLWLCCISSFASGYAGFTGLHPLTLHYSGGNGTARHGPGTAPPACTFSPGPSCWGSGSVMTGLLPRSTGGGSPVLPLPSSGTRMFYWTASDAPCTPGVTSTRSTSCPTFCLGRLRRGPRPPGSCRDWQRCTTAFSAAWGALRGGPGASPMLTCFASLG